MIAVNNCDMIAECRNSTEAASLIQKNICRLFYQEGFEACSGSGHLPDI